MAGIKDGDKRTWGFKYRATAELARDMAERRTNTEYPEGTPRGGGGDRHYLFTLTGAMSSGTGTATIRNMADDTEIETGATIEDTLSFFDGLASGRRGICIKQDGAYYAIGPYVTDVQWDDPDLEYSKDGGTNWTNIDTAEDCT
jgi:hypothetical protein